MIRNIFAAEVFCHADTLTYIFFFFEMFELKRSSRFSQLKSILNKWVQFDSYERTRQDKNNCF